MIMTDGRPTIAHRPAQLRRSVTVDRRPKPGGVMDTIEIMDGWSVAYDAPTLRVVEGDRVVCESTQWDPNMSDPREDALFWVWAIASPDSGLTLESDDDPDFVAGVLYVRANAPAGFADECSILSEEADA